MTKYNAVAVLEGPVTDERIDAAVGALDPSAGLGGFHPAVAELAGRMEVTITIVAEDGPQAVAAAAAIIGVHVPGELRSLHVLPTADYDALVDRLDAVPTLSITEAAEQLGMSRQAVHKAIDAGRLRALDVGGRWVISESAVSEFSAARK